MATKSPQKKKPVNNKKPGYKKKYYNKKKNTYKNNKPQVKTTPVQQVSVEVKPIEKSMPPAVQMPVRPQISKPMQVMIDVMFGVVVTILMFGLLIAVF